MLNAIDVNKKGSLITVFYKKSKRTYPYTKDLYIHYIKEALLYHALKQTEPSIQQSLFSKLKKIN